LLILEGLKNISSGLLQSIGSFVKDGGSLVIIPSNDIKFEDYKPLSALLQIDEYLAKDTTNQK